MSYLARNIGRAHITRIRIPLEGEVAMSVMLTDEELAEINRRVHDGAVMFDQRAPGGWAQTLNRKETQLDVGSLDRCPLGMLYGEYVDGLAALGLTRTEAALFGLTIAYGDGLDDGSRSLGWDNAVFEAMTQAWRREAAQRVAAVPV